MKKTLIAALLCGTSSAAVAGPLLDELLPDGTSYSAGQETAEAGREIYTDLVITAPSGEITSTKLEIARANGMVSLSGREVALTSRNDVTEVGSFDVSFDARIMDGEALPALDVVDQSHTSPRLTAEDCEKIALPLSIQAQGISVLESGNRSTMGGLSVEYAISDPSGSCEMDLAFGVDDIQVAESGIDVSIDHIGFKTHTSLNPSAKAAAVAGQPYTGEILLDGLSVGMNGVEQVALARLHSKADVDPESLTALWASDYFDLMEAIAVSQITGTAPDVSKFNLPAVWNGLTQVGVTGGFKVDSLEITGDMPFMMTGEEVLQKGQSLNLESTYGLNDGSVTFAFDLAASNLVDLDMGIDLSLGQMDPEMKAAGGRALLMQAPISLDGFAIFLKDTGLGALIAQQAGIDPYMMAQMAVPGFLGPQKGALVQDWLEGAKAEGASFRAEPAKSVPVMALFADIMGDWDQAAHKLGVTAQ